MAIALALGLKILVSVVRFRPWPPDRNQLIYSELISIIRHLLCRCDVSSKVVCRHYVGTKKQLAFKPRQRLYELIRARAVVRHASKVGVDVARQSGSCNLFRV
jgi:ribosomal protein S19E (S16A)